MLVIVLIMVLIVAAAVLLAAVTAFPQRGRDVPNAPRVSQVLTKVNEQLDITTPNRGGVAVEDRPRDDA
ncbi:hypothetical protein [Solicola sp. PLA-1-18]|uniref:hypothetical protein n=1 Tax=Solicola sp. PLA-1-18 TaxID=3380532 RepID=UPI003B7A08B6